MQITWKPCFFVLVSVQVKLFPVYVVSQPLGNMAWKMKYILIGYYTNSFIPICY